MRNREKSFCGSMTVEASMVLPLFIFFFVNIMTLFNILKVQVDIEAALHQTGSELTLLAYDLRFGKEKLKGDDDSGVVDAIAGAGGIVYARSKIQQYLGEGIDKSCISGGFNGISFLQSQVLMGNDIIDLVMDYKVHPMIPVIGFKEIPVEGRFYGHAWTGYDISMGLVTEGTEEEMVYVTENGEVYHRDVDCVHLKIKVESVDKKDLSHLRNSDGKIYYACEYCGGNVGAGNVFITSFGTRYHTSVSCPGLKRKIYTIPISEAAGKRPCSSCG